jgi:hypothetical protein
VFLPAGIWPALAKRMSIEDTSKSRE